MQGKFDQINEIVRHQVYAKSTEYFIRVNTKYLIVSAVTYSGTLITNVALIVDATAASNLFLDTQMDTEVIAQRIQLMTSSKIHESLCRQGQTKVIDDTIQYVNVIEYYDNNFKSV